MSFILFVELVMECPTTKVQETKSLIVKLMKGDVKFRETSLSYTQFSNEINIYGNVIPAFKKLLASSNTTSIKIDEWIPRVYYSYFGPYPGLSSGPESILVLENIKPLGFRSGPRLNLDEKHVRLMIKKIAEFHSFSYAMKIQKDPNFEKLVKNIIPFNFSFPDQLKPAAYDILYDVAIDRFNKYLDDNAVELRKQIDSPQFWSDVQNWRVRLCKKPTKLMQQLITVDDSDAFKVILHGDYNRNNILFKYSTDEGFDNPIDIRMFDFQENRYSTPTLDLAFFMYMNIVPELQAQIWDSLLQQYHDTLIKCLCELLNCSSDDPCLSDYTFEKFLAHFSRHSMYGAMVSIHFLPWMMCSESECKQMSTLFESDMTSDAFYDLAMIAGGDETNVRMFKNIQHASENGYMKIFE